MVITANGVDLFYEKSGGGEPLLLLHGNGEDHHIFDVLSAKLQNDFTLYAIDSRNHGQSEKTDVYSYETMAEDVYGFIQSLSLGKVHLLGFSDGAILSLLLAMRHEACVSKMALLGVNLTLADFTDESVRFIKETYETTHDPLFRMMLEQPDIALCDVRAVAVPALVVAGENDIFKPETFVDLAAALPKATLKIMCGHDHDSYIVDQDLLYPDLVHFLSN